MDRIRENLLKSKQLTINMIEIENEIRALRAEQEKVKKELTENNEKIEKTIDKELEKFLRKLREDK